MPSMHPSIIGVLLAGGRARRLGGVDKGLLPLGNGTVLDAVVERARSQVRQLLLNANGDARRFATFGLPIVPDTVSGQPGPLAGVLAGLEWARLHGPDVAGIVTFAADTPFVPRDLVERLLSTRRVTGARLVVAQRGERRHPLAAFWALDLAAPLRRALVAEGVRKVDAWQRTQGAVACPYPARGPDPFFNINTREDLAEAERIHAASAGAGSVSG